MGKKGRKRRIKRNSVSDTLLFTVNNSEKKKLKRKRVCFSLNRNLPSYLLRVSSLLEANIVYYTHVVISNVISNYTFEKSLINHF